MLKKTMKSAINKKFNQWLDTIDDTEVQKVVSENTILTGGAFTSMILNQPINDFDFYLRTKDACLKVAKYYADKWNKSHSDDVLVTVEDCDKLDNVSDIDKGRVKMFIKSSGVVSDDANLRDDNPEELGDVKVTIEEKSEYRPVFVTSNAISLSDKVQIIVRFYGEPENIHDTYDFAHTKAYWASWNNELVVPEEVYEYTTNMVLKYTGSKYPVCSMFRMRKFIKRGWSINAGQILKMAMQISDLDLTNISVLEDQLIGVDSAYFNHLIDQFKERQKKDPNFVLAHNYIISIVDKIF